MIRHEFYTSVFTISTTLALLKSVPLLADVIEMRAQLCVCLMI
jgi:hypothetical protein